MSDRKRSRKHHEDRHEKKKHKESKQDDEGKYQHQTRKLIQEVQKLKHVETFYENPPPGYIKEEDDRPEDCIPDDPGNEDARSFLAHAPTKAGVFKLWVATHLWVTEWNKVGRGMEKFGNHCTKGLWMPLGKEVKVMQCWRCKRYGHRTGDRECPFFIKGNQKLEQFRVAHEDPMYDIIRENKRNEKETRIQQLKQMLEDTTSDSDSTSSSSASSNHTRKKKKKKKEKRKKEKKKHVKKKKKHKVKASNDSDSD